MIVIGTCGLPAGGKSSVAARLQQLGAVWINADRIAHDVLEVFQIREQLVRQFGSTILAADGKIDRPQLAQQVFGDDASNQAALRYLESVVHPPTRTRIIEQFTAALRDHAPATVLDVPLLLESQWELWCDEIWYIETPESTRLVAAAQRGWTAEALQLRTARQLPGSEKRRLASRTILNQGTLEQLRSQVTAIWYSLVQQDRSAGPASHCRDHLLRQTQP
jgi:dephospho-CoA kinase